MLTAGILYGHVLNLNFAYGIFHSINWSWLAVVHQFGIAL